MHGIISGKGSISGSVNIPTKTTAESYRGKDTDTASVTVDNRDRTIAVDVDVAEVTKNSATKQQLSLKQDKLISGSNIKTINNESLLGSGNITINVDLSEYAKTVYVDTFAKSLSASIDSSTYVLTFTLKDANNNTLSTQSIDLPLESMVVGGRYDSTNKDLILTLKSGQDITIPLDDIISGLVSEQSLATTLQDYASLAGNNTFTGNNTFYEVDLANSQSDVVWKIVNDQWGEVSFKRNTTDILKLLNGNVWSKTLIPLSSNETLGNSNNKWKDLYLSGKIKDGTNEVAVSEIATTNYFGFRKIGYDDFKALDTPTKLAILDTGVQLIGTVGTVKNPILFPAHNYGSYRQGIVIGDTGGPFIGSWEVVGNPPSDGFGVNLRESNGGIRIVDSIVKQINGKNIPPYPSSPSVPQIPIYDTNSTLKYVDTPNTNIDDEYDSTRTYNSGDTCIHENHLYKCNADNTTGTWDSSKWDSTTVAELLADETIVRTNTNNVLTGDNYFQGNLKHKASSQYDTYLYLAKESGVLRYKGRWDDARLVVFDTDGIYIDKDIKNYSGSNNIGTSSSQMNKVFTNYISKGNDDISFEDLKGIKEDISSQISLDNESSLTILRKECVLVKHGDSVKLHIYISGKNESDAQVSGVRFASNSSFTISNSAIADTIKDMNGNAISSSLTGQVKTLAQKWYNDGNTTIQALRLQHNTTNGLYLYSSSYSASIPPSENFIVTIDEDLAF